MLDIDFPPRGSKGKRALLGRFDGTKESILISFNHIPARSFFLRRIHHRRYRWRATEKAHAAYKRAIAIAKMDDPSAQSASLLGDIGLLYAKFGDQAQAVHCTRMARAKAPSDAQLMYREGKFMLYWDNPEKRYPFTAKLSRKAIREKKFGTIPKMPNCNPSPSL